MLQKFEIGTICETHDLLLEQVNNLLKLQPASYETVQEFYDDMSTSLAECQDLIAQAKKQGNSMEVRLRNYRLAIERLGFERKKTDE